MFGFGKDKTENKTKAEVNSTVQPDCPMLVVPKCEVIECQMPEITDVHNTFNIICSIANDTKKYRVKSCNSKEIFRLKCVGDRYEFAYISNLHGADYKYPQKNTQYAFIARFFVTDHKNYFVQYIRKDGSMVIRLINDQAWIQKIMSAAEETEEANRIFSITPANNTDSMRSSVLPGKYMNIDDIDYKWIRDEEHIISLEILDKVLYDEIIKDY